MTAQEEREYAEALKRHRDRQMVQLSTIIRGNGDIMRTLGTHGASLARIEEHGRSTDRRLGLVESWQSSKDEEVTATGRHRTDAIEDTLERMAVSATERRRHYTRLVVATVVGLAMTGVVAWATVALAGCG